MLNLADLEQVESWLAQAPKVELHCHLEGSLRASTLLELARLHGLPLPSTVPDELYRYDDLAGFLSVYEVACAAVQTRDDFERVTYEALEDAAACRIVYREMFWNPTLHTTAYQDQLAGILDGVSAAAHDFGIRTSLIPSIYRNQPVAVAHELVATVADHRVDEIVGIGMDGDEISDPPERFIDVYAAIAASGLRRTAHVAHDAPATDIDTALNLLGCERVDHGYHVIDDVGLVDRLRDARVPFMCASVTPPLCGWSADHGDSPIRSMIDAGLRVVLNSDDPPMLHTDLNQEFAKAITNWGLNGAQVVDLMTNAVDAAWLDDVDRSDLRSSIEPALAPLRS